MSTELYELPDGKYVLPADLFFRCSVASRKYHGYIYEMFDTGSEEVYVRIDITSGTISEFNYAIHEGNWYRTHDGVPYTRGYTFIDAPEEIMDLSMALPYSWRL